MILNFEPWQKRVLIGLLGLVILALFALAFTAGRVAAAPQHPGTNSADAGFARDMQVHHTQAVEMSLLVRDRTDDDVVRAIAYDIATTQQHQVGQMYSWLESWGLPQSTAAQRMQWMEGTDHHPGGGEDMLTEEGLMPGMATPEQMEELPTASGEDAERLYLELMITHHTAGVDMAQAGVDLAEQQQVRRLAETMVTAQQSEIQAMQDLLDDL
ncbi:DUF305 domain-containing protein [Arthrobacter sp. H5]|uniref:DUF305 domain-containing protein n=1 Tax=Arthrobacter sp. H5 TaxID=1267973 RepID=UPI0004B918CA|nr:DUF305 domain-containing protein [Arthrobacter sp. H5]